MIDAGIRDPYNRGFCFIPLSQTFINNPNNRKATAHITPSIDIVEA